jgi:DNA repair photolyase
MKELNNTDHDATIGVAHLTHADVTAGLDDIVTIDQALKREGTPWNTRQGYHNAINRGDIYKVPGPGRTNRLSWSEIIAYKERRDSKPRRKSGKTPAAKNEAEANQPAPPPPAPSSEQLVEAAPPAVEPASEANPPLRSAPTQLAKSIEPSASPRVAKKQTGHKPAPGQKNNNAAAPGLTADPNVGGGDVPTNTSSPAIPQGHGGIACTELRVERMNGKPVFLRHADTVLTVESEEFREKLLCDGLIVNLGDACGFTCTYCYVESAAFKFVCSILTAYNRNHGTNLGFQDVVIRRANAIGILRSQLLNEDGTSRYPDPADTRVVFTSTLVDPAANMPLLRETAEACILIFELTHWQIRILSKSVLMARLIEDELIPQKYHDRLILGFSIGTLDDKVATVIEVGASPVRLRLAALHRLQDRGIRTFGMICPSLPQADYDAFSMEICEAIRIERCEHVWAEVLNVRGESRQKTLDALQGAGLADEAERFKSVFFGDGAAANWEKYARRTFEAHTRNVPAEKLRFLQYLKEDSVNWWKGRRADGAVLIGDVAKLHLLQAGGESAPRQALVELTEEDIAYRDEREETVHTAVAASFAASEALHEINTYKDGLLWKQAYPSFVHYCLVKWHYAKSYAYRLLDFGGFINDVKTSSPLGVECKLPLNLGQARPLLELVPKPHQVACWQKIVEVHDVSELTGPMVEKAARAYVKKEGLASRQKAKPRTPDFRAKAIRGVVSLRALLDKLPEPGRFKLLTQGLLILLGVDDTGADLVETQVVDVESETMIDGPTAPPPANIMADAVSKVRRMPKPRQSPTPAKKIAARSGPKAKKQTVKVAGGETPTSFPPDEQQAV